MGRSSQSSQVMVVVSTLHLTATPLSTVQQTIMLKAEMGCAVTRAEQVDWQGLLHWQATSQGSNVVFVSGRY